MSLPRRPPSSGQTAIRHLLALHQALDLPAPANARDDLAHLRLLRQRAAIALASIARLIGDPRSDEQDYLSEADHIRHQLADLPPA
ncbi:MAG TPA: hypothetical protein VLM11_00245 [Streptosporangiaceae bacterium]|nr:hypothetical protein [Streptosporangiaceae bacterium]